MYESGTAVGAERQRHLVVLGGGGGGYAAVRRVRVGGRIFGNGVDNGGEAESTFSDGCR